MADDVGKKEGVQAGPDLDGGFVRAHDHDRGPGWRDPFEHTAPPHLERPPADEIRHPECAGLDCYSDGVPHMNPYGLD